MFSAIGRFTYKFKFLVLAIFTVGLLALGGYGIDVSKHMTSTGYFDSNSDSVKGADLATEAYERDASSDVLLMMYAPAGKTLTDADLQKTINDSLNSFIVKFPDQINQVFSYWNAPAGTKEKMITPEHKIAFASIWLNGEDGTDILNNYDEVKNNLTVPGLKTELAGQIAINGAVNTSTDHDTSRAEIIALPLVAIMLFFIFGGIVAASLPVIIGGLTIAGALGIMKLLTGVMDVNQFTRPVITMIGLGIAIDYGLFIVSRFREEIAENKPIALAVKNTVMTAARTVVFSAILIIGSLCSLFFFPQPFLHSVAVGAIISVGLAAICSLFVLPAILAILGKKVDALALKFLRKTKSKEEIENGFWGKLAGLVMRNPRKIAFSVVALLIVLMLPAANLKLGGIDEKLLPPSNPTRQAMEDFNTNFPQWRTQTIKLVIENATDQQAEDIRTQANKIPGFSTPFEVNSLLVRKGDINVKMYSAGLIDPSTDKEAVTALRAIPSPASNVKIYISGDPALQVDSLQALESHFVPALIFLLLVTFILMFLTFGSFVLPLKAILMTILGMGATLGMLTLIFTGGYGHKVLDFTPGPLMAPVLMLIIAILYGLSTDYEVLLMSRMLEARAEGNSTEESVRLGTAYTGRIITAAAAILIVVTEAFGFSELVLMKYIAFGMIIALLLDATVIRMLLVPAIMKLLGDDCWWAPKKLVSLQHKIGLGEFSSTNDMGLTAVAAYQAQNNQISAAKVSSRVVDEPITSLIVDSAPIAETTSVNDPVMDDPNWYVDEVEKATETTPQPTPKLTVVPNVAENKTFVDDTANHPLNPLLNDNEYKETVFAVDTKTPESQPGSGSQATKNKATEVAELTVKAKKTTESKKTTAKKPTSAKKVAENKKATESKKVTAKKSSTTQKVTEPKKATAKKTSTTKKVNSAPKEKLDNSKPDLGRHAENRKGISAAELLKREKENNNS